MFINMHNHSMHSLYDGFGTAYQRAEHIKSMGQEALALTDHGSITGIIQHYFECISRGIKPIIGIEAYYQPEFIRPEKGDEKPKRYHISLWAKNLQGFRNLMHIVTESNANNFYYKPIVTDELLRKYSEGIICGSACLGGYMSQAIISQIKEDKQGYKDAKIHASKMKSIFGDDFYIEIMPYKVNELIEYEDDQYLHEKDLQLFVNDKLIQIADILKIKLLPTTDSHFVKKSDYPTYEIMHIMHGRTAEYVKNTYKDRYMPSEKEVIARLKKYHPMLKGRGIMQVFDEIYDKIENYELHLETLDAIPSLSDDSFEELKSHTIKGLKRKGKWNKKYAARAKDELKVIKILGFADYFLIVRDIIQFAKSNGIFVGPGRGSVCGSATAYATEITAVDSIKYNIPFERFLRPDKGKMPDVDTDFESARRDEVIEYVLENYEAAQLANFGYYRFDNLINDLAKIYEMDDHDKKELKKLLRNVVGEVKEHEPIDIEKLHNSTSLHSYDVQYPMFLDHFAKLYGQIRFIGTHAAAVVIAPDNDISNWMGLRRSKDRLYCPWDKYDIEKLNLLKMDMLGLSTLDEIKQVKQANDDDLDYEDILDDEDLMQDILQAFANGNTLGVFQVERSKPTQILTDLQPDTADDIFAVIALNRPAPLQLKMDQKYIEAKHGNLLEEDAYQPFIEDYVRETNGVIVYQEQVQMICREIGGLECPGSGR